MTDEPNWAKVLQETYESDIYWEKDQDIDERHTVVEAVDMDPETVQDALAYLSQTELIGSMKAGMRADVSRPGKEGEMPMADVDRQTGLYIGLTTRGFQVAHSREMRRRRDEQNRREAKQQHDVNLAVAILTLGLISVTVIDSAVRALVGDRAFLGAYLFVFLGVGTLLLFTLLLQRRGLLSRFSYE